MPPNPGLHQVQPLITDTPTPTPPLLTTSTPGSILSSITPDTLTLTVNALTTTPGTLTLTVEALTGTPSTPSPAPTDTIEATQPAPTFTFVPTPSGPTATPLAPIFEIHPRQVANKFISTILIAAAGLFFAWLGRRVVHNLLARAHPEIRMISTRFASISILVATGLWILSIFNVNPATLAAVLGSLGLALSLSAQELFKNLVAGVYLLLERPFSVGDEITIGTYTGTVVVIDMRTIILRTAENETVIVPNTLAMSQVVVRRRAAPPAPPAPPVEDNDDKTPT